MEYRSSQPEWLFEGTEIRRGSELDQFRPDVGPQRLWFVRAIGRLYRALDRVQTVILQAISWQRPVSFVATRKPQLYPIRSEIAAHCHPSL